MAEGKHVSHIPSYGAEMRGGTANCSVVVSDEEIASPLVPRPTVCIVMNTPSLLKFQSTGAAGRAADLEQLAHRRAAGAVGRRGGRGAGERDRRGGRFVQGGQHGGARACCSRSARGLASLEAVIAALSEAVSARHRELNEINRAALRKGYELA